jgi:arylformamidase
MKFASMSHSEPITKVTVSATSVILDPADALREALFTIAAALARQGATPGDILRLRISAPAPQAFQLTRRDIDLAWRDALGGLQRPVFYETAPGDLVIEVDAHVQAPREAGPVWRGMTMRELASAYSPRSQADMREVFATWNADGAQFRAGQGGLDIAYGPRREATFDFYPAARRDAPLWVFLHGGYWQACSKDQHGQFAQGMLRHGFAVANLDYSLAPQTPLAGIVLQIRHALQFLVEQAQALGFDANRIHLAGHSAGAHLAAMAASDPHGPHIASALLLSGVFDLEPLSHLPMGAMLGLDARNRRPLSPLFRGRPDARIGVALGALETDEFKRQSAEMADRWGAPAPLHMAGRHHFSLLEDLRAQSPLLDLALHTAG